MKASIIVPFYNVENEIGTCLDSIFEQTYPSIEVILVNDCSTDNSLKVVERYCAAHPRFETIIKTLERNSGASAARNAGINCSTGDYLFFLDSDDAISPTCIEHLTRPLEQKSYDVVIGDMVETGRVLSTKWKLKLREGEWNNGQSIFSEHCHQQIYVNPFNKLCRRDVIVDNQLFFLEGVIHEDVLWSLRLCLSIKSMYVLKEVTYNHICRPSSVSGKELWIEEVNAYIRMIPLMRKAIAQSPYKDDKADIYSYFDDIFFRRYKLCFMDSWKNEYSTLRDLDPRPVSWMMKNCMKSLMYMKAHAHCLLPTKLVTSLMMKLLAHRFDEYRTKVSPHRFKKVENSD